MPQGAAAGLTGRSMVGFCTWDGSAHDLWGQEPTAGQAGPIDEGAAAGE